MAIVRRGEKFGALASAGDVLVNGAIMHLMTVREPFRMASRIVRKADHVLTETGCAALKDLVRLIPASQSDLVGLLQVPLHAAFGTVDSKIEAAFPSGRHL